MGPVSRTRADDACPGALQTHQAADGALARVRIPGGALSADQLAALAGAAEEFGDGTLHLTVRASVQLRGIADTAAVAEAVAGAGLLPSASHERVRNLVASPLTGRCGGLTDVRARVAELDDALCADPGLAALPGRFWFALDDGRGDVAGLGADAAVRSLPDGSAALLLAAADTGVRLDPAEAIPALLTVARRFAAVRDNAWRIAELADPEPLLAGWVRAPERVAAIPVTRPPVGWIAQDDGLVALGAAVPLGVLTARQAQFLAAMGAPVVITPWRSILVCDLDEGVADTALRVLPPLGLVFDETSRWLRVSACVGSPGCERSRADVRADAARAVAAGHGGDPAPGADAVVHYAGCERACGRPVSGRVLVATGEGYRPLG